MVTNLTPLTQDPPAAWREISAHIISDENIRVNDDEVKLALQDQIDAAQDLIIWSWPNVPAGKMTIEQAAGLAGYIEGRIHALGFVDVEVTFDRADDETVWAITLGPIFGPCVLHEIERCTICM